MGGLAGMGMSRRWVGGHADVSQMVVKVFMTEGRC